MEFYAKKFSQLTTDELYEILKSRAEVFLLEQRIVCQDMDDADRDSLHCFFRHGQRIIGYLRVFPVDCKTVKIGRVLTLEHKKGLGSELMRRSIEEIKKHFNVTTLCVHAQKQAEKFYEKQGFVTVSDEYLEEGVVHVTMEMEVSTREAR